MKKDNVTNFILLFTILILIFLIIYYTIVQYIYMKKSLYP